MTAYLLTPEQHAQIVEAVESNAEYAEAEYLDRREFWGDNLPYRWENLKAESEQARATLAMLKAMEPATARAYITETVQGPMVWTPEMYCEACTYCDDDEFPEPLYTLGDSK